MNAFVNLSKSFLGTSVFALPWAMSQGGLWASILCLALFGVVSAHTLKLLGRCRKVSAQKDPSFVDLGYEAFGVAGARVVTVAIVAMSLGVCAAYLVFISGTLQTILLSHGGPGLRALLSGGTTLGRVFSMIVLLPVAIPLSFMRDFKVSSKGGIFFCCSKCTHIL
jgi:amino acid permease